MNIDLEAAIATVGDEFAGSVVAVTPDGVVIHWDGKAEGTFGYKASEAVGRSIDELLVPVGGRELHGKWLGIALELGSAQYEAVRRRKDGSLLTVETVVRPVRDAEGNLLFVAFNKRDITRLKFQANAKLLATRFRGLEAAPDAMILADGDGRIVLVNEQTEKLFGYRQEELLGREVEILVPQRFRKGHPKLRKDYSTHPQLRPMGAGRELYGLRKDRTEFPVEISLRPMDTEDGQLVSAAIRDITDRKQADALRRKAEALEEDRLREANRLKSEFLANMSHELRTPLNAIIGFAELMHDGRVGPVSEAHQEYLGDILASSRHLLQLINDVLDLSKVEAGKMEFHLEQTDPARLVAEVREVLRTLVADKQIEVRTEISPAVGHVVADTRRLKQVLYNFLSNAVKYTPEGGRVTARVLAEDEDHFRVEVEDTGDGIAPEDLGRLFVEFQQLDGGFAKKHGGTGLGLALVRGIVEAQGGRVAVRSTKGVGSMFSAVLPRVAPSEPKVNIRGGSVRLQPVVGNSPTILVIEDQHADRSLMLQVLLKAGFAVEVAATGMEALDLCKERRFDAITLDLMLPDSNGREILKKIREGGGPNAETPVVVVTVVAERASLAGLLTHDFLVKPVNGSVLLASLERAGVVTVRQEARVVEQVGV